MDIDSGRNSRMETNQLSIVQKMVANDTGLPCFKPQSFDAFVQLLPESSTTLQTVGEWSGSFRTRVSLSTERFRDRKMNPKEPAGILNSSQRSRDLQPHLTESSDRESNAFLRNAHGHEDCLDDRGFERHPAAAFSPLKILECS